MKIEQYLQGVSKQKKYRTKTVNDLYAVEVVHKKSSQWMSVIIYGGSRCPKSEARWVKMILCYIDNSVQQKSIEFH